MIVSTGNICEQYRTIDSIFHLVQMKPGGFMGSGGIDLQQGFQQAKAEMAEIARSMGGNAIINCDFELRVAVTQFANAQVFELFAFGTVVEITSGADAL